MATNPRTPDQIYLNFPDQCSQDQLHRKMDYLLQEGFSWYEHEAADIFGKPLPNRSDTELIEQTLFKTAGDKIKKASMQCYYVSNVITFLKVTTSLATELSDLLANQTNIGGQVTDNYVSVIRRLLFDSLILLNHCCQMCMDCPTRYPVTGNNLQHHFSAYQAVRQALFGQISYHAFSDSHPDIAVALIRLFIELRIRHGIGIIGYRPSGKLDTLGINMSKIFEVIKQHQSDLVFSIPLHVIERIYKWANFFVHSGICDYSWKPIFVVDFIRDLACGIRHETNGRWDVNNGVVIPDFALRSIRQDILQLVPKGATLVEIQPFSVPDR